MTRAPAPPIATYQQTKAGAAASAPLSICLGMMRWHMPNGCLNRLAKPIACPAKRNGNMRRVRRRRQSIGGVMTLSEIGRIVWVVGVSGTVNGQQRSVPLIPTRSDLWTRWVMYGNGHRTAGMKAMRVHRRMLTLGYQAVAASV